MLIIEVDFTLLNCDVPISVTTRGKGQKMKLLYMVIEYKFAEDDIDIIFIDDRTSSYFTYS